MGRGDHPRHCGGRCRCQCPPARRGGDCHTAPTPHPTLTHTQADLPRTANNIGVSRHHYKNTAAQYNQPIAVCPNNGIAGMFNFGEMDFFDLDDDAQREAPKVSF